MSPAAVQDRPARPARAAEATPIDERFTPRPDPLYHLVWLGLCSGVLLLAMLLSVRGKTQVLLPLVGVPLPELCMLRRTWGLACPGCGLTRCFIALAHGDLAAAWSYNPAGLWLFALLVVQLPLRTVQLWRIRRGLPEVRLNRAAQAAVLLLVVVILGQWLLRLAGMSF